MPKRIYLNSFSETSGTLSTLKYQIILSTPIIFFFKDFPTRINFVIYRSLLQNIDSISMKTYAKFLLTVKILITLCME